MRGFDQDERLIGVAFTDVAIWTTTITVFKNLLLIGDVVRSIQFVAFQVRPPPPPPRVSLRAAG